ncbi:PQQ-like beta-propeller repeat protein [Pontiellaceae bacterium B12227]|nr:PQQ-like beta-propeller repeat protein [Pontiellaceae bacterium B12227]
MQNQSMLLIRLLMLIFPLMVFADWPQFLGPNRDGKQLTSSSLSRCADQLQVIWESPRGESYSAPSTAEGKLIHFYRAGNMERVECLDAETGSQLWVNTFRTTYRDRFHYLNGPRSTPCIKDDRVYTLGAQGILSCLQLESGQVLWRRNLVADYDITTEFFGFATSPLIEGDSIIINLGMKKSMVAFDLLTGDDQWMAGEQWGRSYASPMAATVYGKRVLLVFAGGESSPPVGGLICADPDTGTVHDRFAWRSPRHASVNASTPVVSSNRVFISSSYDVGGVMLEIQPDLSFREVYRTKAYSSHWATPILVDGYLYGFSNNKLVCMNWETGERIWRMVPKVGNAAFRTLEARGGGANRYRPPPGQDGFGIGNLTYVDDRFLCLGENGLLAWMKLSPEGCEVISWARLFTAEQTWTAPVVSNDRIFICQNLPEIGKKEARLICLGKPNAE